MTTINRITFVWNADFSLAGGVRALREVAKGEHSCSLCEIAYNRVTQTSEWKAYKAELSAQYGADIRQPCKNQLSDTERAIACTDYPCVLAHTHNGVVKLLGQSDIDACEGHFALFRKKLDAALANRAAN